MLKGLACSVLLFCLTYALCAPAQSTPDAQHPPLTITVTEMSDAWTGQAFHATFSASHDGLAPFHWSVVGGALPAGLKLDERSGVLEGVPAEPGDYHFTVGVSDSSSPHRTGQKDVNFTIRSSLSIEWDKAPAVDGHRISGAVLVANHTAHAFNLTVIVMAVNDIGRATALGYQHFLLKAQAEQVIPFGASPGAGNYIIHADAVAHVPHNGQIYRARKQTAQKLTVAQPI